MNLKTKLSKVIPCIKNCQADEKTHMKHKSGSDALYGIGVIGAFIYFMQHATSFGAVLWGIVMAVFWPAVVLYKILELLHL